MTKSNFARMVSSRTGGGWLVLVLALLVACRGDVVPWREDATRDPLEASGIIYAEEIEVSSEFGGRVANLPVAEGQRVAAGDPVVELDTALIDAQIEVAEAMVAMAEAGLAQAEAGASPGQIAVAEAQQAQAEAGWMAAQQAVTDTRALVENPQEIDLQIALARGQLESAGYQLDEAVALKDLATDLKRQADAVWAQYGEGGRYRFPVTWEDLKGELPPELEELLPEEPPEPPSKIEDLLPDLDEGTYTFGDWELVVDDGDCQLYKWMDVHIPHEVGMAYIPWWQSWIGVNAASARQEGVEASLALLYDRRAHPQELESALDEAQSSRAQMEAQMAMAEAQVAGFRAGASPEQIAALEARVAQARAGRASLLQQRAMMTLEAPRDGTVVSLIVRRGEVAAAGATLVTLAELDEVTLTVYVPESRIGEVRVGQPVTVTVDSFPGRTFRGEVSTISDRAEFTPRNVATKEERVTLVFGVDVRIPNGAGALKPGMPADAVFETQVFDDAE